MNDALRVGDPDDLRHRVRHLAKLLLAGVTASSIRRRSLMSVSAATHRRPPVFVKFRHTNNA
jgi:hypothetical protein